MTSMYMHLLDIKHYFFYFFQNFRELLDCLNIKITDDGITEFETKVSCCLNISGKLTSLVLLLLLFFFFSKKIVMNM